MTLTLSSEIVGYSEMLALFKYTLICIQIHTDVQIYVQVHTDTNIHRNVFLKVSLEILCIIQSVSPAFLSLKLSYILIQVAPGSIISLSFTSFNLQSSSSCSMAYVEIRDGPRATDNLIGRYCGSSPPPTATSTKDNMYIRFYHNAASGSVGFRASFGAGNIKLIYFTIARKSGNILFTY